MSPRYETAEELIVLSPSTLNKAILLTTLVGSEVASQLGLGSEDNSDTGDRIEDDCKGSWQVGGGDWLKKSGSG